MKHMRIVTWLSGLVGLLGLLLCWIGLHCTVYPSAWMYLGVLMFVWALVALVCLFMVRVLDALCDLHKAFQLH